MSKIGIICLISGIALLSYNAYLNSYDDLTITYISYIVMIACFFIAYFSLWSPTTPNEIIEWLKKH